MSATMKQHNHLARIDTHRVQLMDLDADEYGAPEGGRLPEAEPAPADSLVGPLLGLLSILLVALVAAAALVWP